MFRLWQFLAVIAHNSWVDDADENGSFMKKDSYEMKSLETVSTISKYSVVDKLPLQKLI